MKFYRLDLFYRKKRSQHHPRVLSDGIYQQELKFFQSAAIGEEVVPLWHSISLFKQILEYTTWKTQPQNLMPQSSTKITLSILVPRDPAQALAA